MKVGAELGYDGWAPLKVHGTRAKVDLGLSRRLRSRKIFVYDVEDWRQIGWQRDFTRPFGGGFFLSKINLERK